MKKLALVLGSLVVVSSIASAKEVVATPVVGKEVVPAPIAVVCEEKTPEWRPTGNVTVEYTYFGKNEFDSEEFGKVRTEGMVHLTPNQRIDFRTNSFNTYTSKDGLADENLYGVGDFEDSTYLRLRYYYSHGKVANTKATLTSRVLYQNSTGFGGFMGDVIDEDGESDLGFEFGNREQRLEYMAMLQLSPYFDWTPEWFKNTDFKISPRYRHSWSDQSSDYANTLGTDVSASFDLPVGFSTTVNLYPRWTNYGTEGKDSVWALNIEWYLMYAYNLYESGKTAIDFNFEGGIDDYGTKSNKSISKGFRVDSNGKNSIYAQPSIDLTYQATRFITLNAGVAGEYRNWEDTKVSELKNWSWMPKAYTSFTVKF